MSIRDVIIVGAGPSGLSAAIAAKQRNLDYLVLEQGVLVNSIYRFPPQMVFFTTPELLEIGGLPFVSPYDKPTRIEALKYYRKVVDAYDLQIAYEEKVESIEREQEEASGSGGSGESGGSGGLVGLGEKVKADDATVFVVTTRSARGVQRARYARHVVMAIGYYDHPVRLGIPGEDLPHVHHYYGEPHPHYRQRVVVVGGGNSAADYALELYRAGAHVTIVHRAPSLKSTIKYWVRPDIENRIKEGSIAARFNTCVTAIRPASVIIKTDTSRAAGTLVGSGPNDASVPAGSNTPADSAAPPDAAADACAPREPGVEEELPADAVYLLTGYRADADLLCRAGVALNDRSAPVYDRDTFETNVSGLFVAGGAVAGIDTGTIFIENGRFHGERIIDVIARRS
jgi:bacillithiol disulfide reductase